ncbi:FixH family protein [Parvularcula lutaonensis]|uniref:FixH family protein n=1 Tax=Parvularcula lutaonensis TaxID=491923 RepID=A0ABV7M8S0_9PROT|nr:FixH family protein [Parvularcula lutaonensis]GGY45562.1 hypothetical protein GCM10007148_13210 [Parvularcula lutaonensis]
MMERRSGNEITGRHVLFAFIAFFAVVIVTDTIFVKLAVTSFPGEQVEKSYYQGLNFNDQLAEKKRQAAQGWRLKLVENPRAGETRRLVVRLETATGEPLADTVLTGRIVRPVTDRGLQNLDFEYQGNGLYTAEITPLDRGVWDLSLKATAEGDTEPGLEATRRMMVP